MEPGASGWRGLEGLEPSRVQELPGAGKNRGVKVKPDGVWNTLGDATCTPWHTLTHLGTSWHTWARPHGGHSAKKTSQPQNQRLSSPRSCPFHPQQPPRALTCPLQHSPAPSTPSFPRREKAATASSFSVFMAGPGHRETAAPPGEAAPGAGEGGHSPARGHSDSLLLLLFLFFLLLLGAPCSWDRLSQRGEPTGDWAPQHP